MTHRIHLDLPETGGTAPQREQLIRRFACHFLVDLIDDEGLPELSETLADVYDYYRRRAQPLRCLPHAASVQGVWGAPQESANLRIEEG